MFKGAMTAMVTPFAGEKIDENRLSDQVDYQIRNGIAGLVPVGTTGESPTLDFDEHIRVIELTVQHAKGRVPVIGGTGANATAEALELHRRAKAVGASAGLSVNPYYNKPSQEGLYRHFMTIADSVDLPIVLYNIPGRTGITMSPATVARLAKHPNIVAIKESTGSMDTASEIAALCDLTIISGDDSLTLPLIALGATGVISVASNIIPRQIADLTNHALAGRLDEARKLHLKLFNFIKSLFIEGNPVGIKCAMKIAGLDSGQVRLPLAEVSPATRAIVEEAMKEAGAPFAV